MPTAAPNRSLRTKQAYNRRPRRRSHFSPKSCGLSRRDRYGFASAERGDAGSDRLEHPRGRLRGRVAGRRDEVPERLVVLDRDVLLDPAELAAARALGRPGVRAAGDERLLPACEYTSSLLLLCEFVIAPYTNTATSTNTARFPHTFSDDFDVDDEVAPITSGGAEMDTGGRNGDDDGPGAPAADAQSVVEAVAPAKGAGGATSNDPQLGHLIAVSAAAAPHSVHDFRRPGIGETRRRLEQIRVYTRSAAAAPTVRAVSTTAVTANTPRTTAHHRNMMTPGGGHRIFRRTLARSFGSGFGGPLGARPSGSRRISSPGRSSPRSTNGETDAAPPIGALDDVGPTDSQTGHDARKRVRERLRHGRSGERHRVLRRRSRRHYAPTSASVSSNGRTATSAA